MRFFIKEIMIIFLTTLMIGEITCRTLPIVPDIPVKANKEGYYVLKENQSGDYIRGKFPRWLNAKYSINNLGFVSSRDYFFDENNENKVAIIGDSFVESFQVNSNQSIGRLIESKRPNITVYEFGFSGYNFNDYKDIYEKFNLNNFKYVFIIVDQTDIFANKPSKELFTPALELKENFFRGIYNNLYFFKYLNWNHAFIRELINIPSKINPYNFQINKPLKGRIPSPINSFVIDNKNIRLILKSKKDIVLKNYYPELSFISIDQKIKPYDFGFDKHWNKNGRENVANTIIKCIDQL